MATKSTKSKKTIKRKISSCNVYIRASFNNTHISLTDKTGAVLAWASAGKLNFSGARKATPHAATQIMNNILEKIKTFAVHEVNVYVNGVGIGREAALRSLSSSPIIIQSITDITPLPHNGPRPPKKRRV